MRLLKKNTPFFWDDQAQCSFDSIKHTLNHSLVIHPPDYSKYFLLYIAASATTIAMVLVQDNLHGQEHVIYYASKNLIDSETRYSHVEKLALATVITVQKFRHYILLCTSTILVDQNLMYYILTSQVLRASTPIGSSSFRSLTLSLPRLHQINPWFTQGQTPEG